VDFESPALSAISPFPRSADPGLNALKMSMPLSRDRLALEIPGFSKEGGFIETELRMSTTSIIGTGSL
jgi:hypothetical protein